MRAIFLKKLVTAILLIVFSPMIIFANSNSSGANENRAKDAPTANQNLLNNPESVIYDPYRNRYLVSNWGDGTIVQIDSNGIQSYFSTDLLNQYRLAGLYVYNDTLLAAAGDAPDAGIAGFNLETGEKLFFIILPEIGLPNDITSDKDGIIYVTDYWGDKLYKIKNRAPSILIPKGILNYPNGMMYDVLHHRLLILSVMGPGTPILGVNLPNSSVSTVFTTGFHGADGITMDNDGRFYVSEWTNDTIYRYDNNFSSVPELFLNSLNDPADIYYDSFNNILAVPNFSSNTVDFVPITPASIEDKKGWVPQNFKLYQNYPNPFNAETIIPFELSHPTNITLRIYNVLGNEIISLADNVFYQDGYHSLKFDAGLFSSGIYFYDLTSNHGFTQVKKMCIIK